MKLVAGRRPQRSRQRAAALTVGDTRALDRARGNGVRVERQDVRVTEVGSPGAEPPQRRGIEVRFVASVATAEPSAEAAGRGEQRGGRLLTLVLERLARAGRLLEERQDVRSKAVTALRRGRRDHDREALHADEQAQLAASCSEPRPRLWSASATARARASSRACSSSPSTFTLRHAAAARRRRSALGYSAAV